jgi:hypothetical protein
MLDPPMGTKYHSSATKVVLLGTLISYLSVMVVKGTRMERFYLLMFLIERGRV